MAFPYFLHLRTAVHTVLVCVDAASVEKTSGGKFCRVGGITDLEIEMEVLAVNTL